MNVLKMVRWFTLALWLIWLAFYWLAPRLAGAKGNRSAGSRPDTLLMGAIGTALVALAGISLCVTLGWLPAPIGGPFAFAGMALVCTGLFGMFYARRYLGRMWVAATALQREHQIVDTGPYGLVRHPIYTFVILFVLGTVLVFPHWANGLAGALAAACYALKATVEERFLAASLPGYAGYRQKVRYRLVPYIW